MAEKEIALIVGAGSGLSASMARLAAREGMQVAVAARRPEKLEGLVNETGGRAYACDATQQAEVEALFDRVGQDFGVPDLVLFNASYRQRGPFVELDPDEVEKSIAVSCFAGFLVGQTAAKAMLPRGSGSILFTGASASVKGYPHSAPFAMGKFGLRGLAQSMARELAPQGLHVAHFVIDGGIGESPAEAPGSRLHPDNIAETYMYIHRQPRSAWTWEVELRPWVEKF